MSRIYLDTTYQITAYENHLVTVTAPDGTAVSGLEPRRLFPVSAPQDYITLLNESGEECFVIRHLTDLSAQSRGTIEQSLADYYLVPIIQKILSKEEKYGTLRWTVLTDRGQVSFDIRNRNHDIRTLPDRRIRVRDSSDNRYIINGIDSLDARSRAILLSDT